MDQNTQIEIEENILDKAGKAQESNKEQERTFTIEEVNGIVQSRLARAKMDNSAELTRREDELTKRELQLDARERLADAGLPKELLTAINCSDRETMEKSIKTLASYIGANQSVGNTGYRITPPPGFKGGLVSTGGSNSGPGNACHHNDDPSIRKAMGLKG